MTQWDQQMWLPFTDYTPVAWRSLSWGLFQSVTTLTSSNIIGTASWGIDTFVESNETVHQPNKKAVSRK
jgi:hypothetical protein